MHVQVNVHAYKHRPTCTFEPLNTNTTHNIDMEAASSGSAWDWTLADIASMDYHIEQLL